MELSYLEKINSNLKVGLARNNSHLKNKKLMREKFPKDIC
jgi:hypothetical protein